MRAIAAPQCIMRQQCRGTLGSNCPPTLWQIVICPASVCQLLLDEFRCLVGRQRYVFLVFGLKVLCMLVLLHESAGVELCLIAFILWYVVQQPNVRGGWAEPWVRHQKVVPVLGVTKLWPGSAKNPQHHAPRNMHSKSVVPFKNPEDDKPSVIHLLLFYKCNLSKLPTSHKKRSSVTIDFKINVAETHCFGEP